MPVRSTASPVIVVGGGIGGIACARRLHDAGLPVRVLERAHRLGGRMAARTEQIAGRAHQVDLGAPYFTVRDGGFADVVAGWQRAGLAREWTDRFATASPGRRGVTGVSVGPQRWSARHGLRGLVEALAQGLEVELDHEVSLVAAGTDGGLLVDGEPARAVVLAMPDPQAARLLPAAVAADLGVVDQAWTPVLVAWAVWPKRCWPSFDGVFVTGSSVINWVADSGHSHGDGAPVLVVHSTAGFAERHLDDPSSALGPMLAELSDVLGEELPAPVESRVHRWSFASAREPHAALFGVTCPPAPLIGVCGDGWGPRSRVEQAWCSGERLAEVLVTRLAVS